MEKSDFKSMSVEVVKRFLQTVVVVDDEAAFTAEDDVPKKDVQAPERPVAVDVEATEEEEQEQEEVPTWDDEAHRLDAKEMIDAFANQGLVCAVLRPESQDEVRRDQGEDSLLDRVTRVGDRSDLIVLDWDIGKDGGEKARQIIQEITENAAKVSPRWLRLIVVYTGEGDLSKIADSIAHVFDPECREEEGLVLRRGAVRVAVYAKHSARNIGPHSSRRVSFQNLPERLITEFAKMTEGLVSNTAVESLSVLRENTYSLLTRLHSDLDAPYLTHRMLISEPDDATDFLVALIASELRGVLDEQSVGTQASGHAIEAWLEERHSSKAQFEIGNNRGTNSLSRDQVKQWLLEGYFEPYDEGRMKYLRKKSDEITAQLSNEDADQATRLDMEFAMLTSLRTRDKGTEIVPMLTLGTIVEDITDVNEGSPQYWLCIQPRCDSVRLGGEQRMYPLLPYEVKEPSQGFELVLRDSNEDFVCLKLIDEPSKCSMIPFKPLPESQHIICATKQEAGFVFESETSGPKGRKRYKWIADLKYEQAQRSISRFASRMSSVGLDEFEWLRLSAKK